MKQLTDKQKKAAWIIALVLVVMHFANPLILSIRQRLSTPAAPVFHKPSPAIPYGKPQVALTQPAAPAPVPAPHPSSEWTGVWLGSELMPNQYTCQFRLEVRDSPDKQGDYAGYLTRRCIPTAPIMGGKITQQKIPGLIEAISPVSGIYDGQYKDGVLQLHLTRAIGTAADGCELTDYTLASFGEQVAAQWQAGKSCPSGQAMFTRARA